MPAFFHAMALLMEWDFPSHRATILNLKLERFLL
jgi:hypothetical protein